MAKRPKAEGNKAKDVEKKPIKFYLSILERLGFSALMPKQGNIITQVMCRDIEGKVRFTQAEIKKSGMKPTDKGGIRWDTKAKDVGIVFTNAEITLLREQVDKLDQDNKITPDNLSLCLKIRERK